MKIYKIEGRLRRLGLINKEVVIIEADNYLFVEEGKEDIGIVNLVREAVGRGIVVWEGTAGKRITNLDASHVTTRRDKMFEFVIEKAEDQEWIRTLIKKILMKEAKGYGGDKK